MKNGRSIKRVTILLGLFLLLAGISITEAVAEEFSSPGLIEAWALVTMKAKASGTIGHIAIEEGAMVKEGSILLGLDNNREKALIRLSESRVSKTRASLIESKVVLQNSKRDLD